jgi:hypothetical protein
VHDSNPHARVRRPFGVNVALSYFVSYIVLYSFRVLVDLDFRLYRFIFNPARIPGLIFLMLSMLAVIGLTQMREWGRVFAIISSGVMTSYVLGWYCVLIGLRLWTLLPHGVRSNIELILKLTFGIFVVWYLLRSKTRNSFRASETIAARPRTSSF